MLTPPIRHVMELLALRDYVGLEALTSSNRLTSQEIEDAIRDYGRTVVSPPDVVFELMEIYEVRDPVVPTWAVVAPLWTLEEGRSDLSLEVTLKLADGRVVVELDNILVA